MKVAKLDSVPAPWGERGHSLGPWGEEGPAWLQLGAQGLGFGNFVGEGGH